MLAKELSDGEHHVGRGHTFLRGAGQFEADHGWDQHGGGLAEHGCFGFNAADTPAEDAETVDHGGVAVGADHGVRECHAVSFKDDSCKVLHVDLVTDSHAGGNDAEGVKGTLGPTKELVTLDVALVLNCDVFVIGRSRARTLNNDRVVGNELNGHQGVDLGGATPEFSNDVSHGGEVDDCRDASQVLHEDALGAERDFSGGLSGCLAVASRGFRPAGQRFDVSCGYLHAVFVTEEVLKKNLDGIREARHVGNSSELVGREGEVVQGLASHVQGCSCTVAVGVVLKGSHGSKIRAASEGPFPSGCRRASSLRFAEFPLYPKGRTMPRYDYRCNTCDQVYELSRSMADADAPALCPSGHEGAVRMFPLFATTGGALAPQPQGGGGCCGGGCCH